MGRRRGLPDKIEEWRSEEVLLLWWEVVLYQSGSKGHFAPHDVSIRKSALWDAAERNLTRLFDSKMQTGFTVCMAAREDDRFDGIAMAYLTTSETAGDSLWIDSKGSDRIMCFSDIFRGTLIVSFEWTSQVWTCWRRRQLVSAQTRTLIQQQNSSYRWRDYCSCCSLIYCSTGQCTIFV